MQSFTEHATRVRTRRSRNATDPGPVEPDRRLELVQDAVVRKWGELGRPWGSSRTAAELYALLHVCGRSVCADDVIRRLNFSRGSVSIGLRSLCDAGLVRRFNVMGDRRDFFAVAGNLWEAFGVVVAERQRRALGPVVDAARQCRAMLDADDTGPATVADPRVAVTRARLLAVEELMTKLHGLVQPFADGTADRAAIGRSL